MAKRDKPLDRIMAVVTVTVSVEVGPWSPADDIAGVIEIAERDAPKKLKRALEAQPDMHVNGAICTRVVASREKF